MMKVFNAATATPSTRYIKIADEGQAPTVRPYLVLGNPDNGGLTGTWSDILSWLNAARREVELEMRKRYPATCSQTPDGEHQWTLVESGCDRIWTDPEITETDDDDGRADGARRTRAVANALDEGDVSDGEDYFLQCRSCVAERNVDDVDFV